MSARELVIELTASEQWSMEQVGTAMARAKEMAHAAHEGLASAQNGVESAGMALQAAEDHRLAFVEAVLKAHKRADPGTPPALSKSDLGMRITWPPKPKVEKPVLKRCPTCPSSPPNLMKASDSGCCGQCSEELKTSAERRMADE